MLFSTLQCNSKMFSPSVAWTISCSLSCPTPSGVPVRMRSPGSSVMSVER